MWLLGFVSGWPHYFCASCHTEKVSENFDFTTHVCYTNIVSKK
nr:MAG TPA: cytochrome oxidase subunit II [Caudoviricetes sp.]